MSKMTLEQLQDKLLPILFDDNDKFEDVNRANILYDRETKKLTIKRTKFDFLNCKFIDIEITTKLTEIVKCRGIGIVYSDNPIQMIITIYDIMIDD